MAQMKKADLINILVDEYGYEKEEVSTLTVAKLKSLIDTEEKDALEYEKSKSATREKYAPVFEDNDRIAVMSGSSGGVTHKGRNGQVWKFKQFGQQDKIPYGELVSMKNVCPAVLEQGYILVLDKEVAEILGLSKVYENILTPQDIDSVFSKSAEELAGIIDNLPEGLKLAFISRARELYHQQKIYDIRVINIIQEKFGFSLEDNAPLSNKL